MWSFDGAALKAPEAHGGLHWPDVEDRARHNAPRLATARTRGCELAFSVNGVFRNGIARRFVDDLRLVPGAGTPAPLSLRWRAAFQTFRARIKGYQDSHERQALRTLAHQKACALDQFESLIAILIGAPSGA
ncbi:hypothetical protein AABE10_33300 [Paraburkholderia diazotrophica]